MLTITENRPFEMHNPPHPGGVFRRLYLDSLGITVTECARRLGITRKTLSEIVNGRAGISPEMALRIAKATDTSAEGWIEMQAYYDLWQAKKAAKKLHVRRLAA